MATRRAGVREVAQEMADSIQMHVTRYDPDQDSAPKVATYEVPLRRDWAILDGAWSWLGGVGEGDSQHREMFAAALYMVHQPRHGRRS